MYLRRHAQNFQLIIILFFEIVFLILRSNIFGVKTIVTDGYNSQVFYHQGGKNLLILKTEKLEKELLEENPQLSSVVIKKKFPDRLIINTKKRQPLFYITDRQEKKSMFSDGEGVVFEEAIPNLGFPVIVVDRINVKIGVRLNKPEEKTAFDILKLTKEKGLNCSRVEIKGKIVYAYINFIKIVFNSEHDISSDIEALQFMLKRFTIEGNMPGEIDLRFGKPVLKGREEIIK